MACTLYVAWDDRLAGYDFGAGHPMPPARLELTIELARALGLFAATGVSVERPAPATDAELGLVHIQPYIAPRGRAGEGAGASGGRGRWPALAGGACRGGACVPARPSLTCVYYAYWSGVASEGEIEAYFPPRRVILVFPTNDGQVCTYLAWPRAEFRSVRADAAAELWAVIAQVPALAGRLRAGRRATRVVGTGDLPNFFRTPYGPGWALAGDAGYHRDPLTAQGISDAFRDAQLLSEAIDAGLTGRQPLAEALAGYQARRDETSTAMYELTCQRAALEPPAPQAAQLVAALAGNQHDTDQFLGVLAGTVAIPEFFAPDNIQRILAASSAA